MKLFFVGCFLLYHQLSLAQEELLKNPDFEEEFGDDNWFCNGPCSLDQSTDSNTGEYSGFVSGRTSGWNGVSQFVQLDAGKSYVFRAYVKYRNLVDGFFWHEARSIVRVTYTSGEEENFTLGRVTYIRPDWGWQEVGGDIAFSPDRPIEQVRVFVQIQDQPEVDYFIDTASLKEVPFDPDWKDEANARIEQIRKGDLTINVDIGDNCDPENVEINVDMIKHDFPWGTALRAFLLHGDEYNEQYLDTFLENFNYAVLENSLKWRGMERNRGTINYDRPDGALDVLDSFGIPCRGHAVFWGIADNNPDWLTDGSYEGEELRAELYRRMNYTVPYYRDRLTHWDVNNEQIHGDWYEQTVGDHQVTQWLFREVHDMDPDTELFLNDYGVIRDGLWTVAFTNSAKNLLEQDVPVHGLGLQSHIRLYPDVNLISSRLDTLATAGLPMWSTELDIENPDVEERADGYEDIMRLLFSRPEVHGVLLWGFWDQYHSKPEAALFEGDDLEPNAAGLRWQYMLNEEWTTRVSFAPGDEEGELTVKAFFGNYSVTVLYDGDEVLQEYFYFGRDGDDTINIEIEDCNDH